MSILPSGFNVHYEQALAAAKNELDEIAAMDEEAKQKVMDIEKRYQVKFGGELDDDMVCMLL